MRFRPGPELLRFAAMVGVLVAGASASPISSSPAPEDTTKPKPALVLRVAGVDVSTKGDLVANALDLVRRYATGEVTLKLP